MFDEVTSNTWHNLFVLQFLLQKLEEVDPMEVFFFFSSRITLNLFELCHAKENVCRELAGRVDIEELMEELIMLKQKRVD